MNSASSHSPRPSRCRVLLILGRISNLPTVWSNCLAAWWLGGGGSVGRFALLGMGATLLYTGGMFFNDAFDVDFDRRYRPERPIPAGWISRGAVWAWGSLFLVGGLAMLAALGTLAGCLGLLLAATILIYDAVHKHTVLAPWLMSGCRFLLYLVASAAASRRGVEGATLWRAAALMVYVLGISFLARRESLPGRAGRWPIGLLFAPMTLAWPIGSASPSLRVASAAAVFGGWVLWCQSGKSSQRGRWLSGGVPGLLAGIALLDGLAVVTAGLDGGWRFSGLFLLALVLQRRVPAS